MNLIKTAYSTQTSIVDAVNHIKSQFSGMTVQALIYFASSAYDHNGLNTSIRDTFPGTELIGCSTSGEIVSGAMLKQSVVAMGFQTDVIKDIKIAVIENIGNPNLVADAFKTFEEHFGESMNSMNHNEYVGIILMDGLSRAEEKIMDRIGDLTNVTFIGGSAGDDLKFQKTFVTAQGITYGNAAVLALIKPAIPFGFIKTQSFKTLDKKLMVTKSIEETREVLEFNNKPASQAYAEALGETVETAKDRFMKNPVGLMVGGIPFVRSPQQILGDRMVFYCNMIEGMELSLLESTDIISETQTALDEKTKEMGKITAIINFNCILRTLDLENRGLTQAYADLFANIPTIGFSTYGEAYIGHINQTATMLVFG